jgi:hypothetical protein
MSENHELGSAAAGKPAATTENPAIENPATENSATQNPATDISATQNPATESPATESPATESPATESPATENSETDVSAAEDNTLSQDERAELEQLRAEKTKPRRRRFSWHAVVSTLLIVLGCILAIPAVVGSWAALEVSNTDRWVGTVEPLIHDPAIQNVLTDRITNEITSRLDITGTIDQASAQLNSRGLTRISGLLKSFGPQIASSVTGFIRSTVHTAVSSQAMATAWVKVNTVAHQSLVKVLSGQGGGAVSAQNGQIVLNLGPLIDVAKQALIAHGFSLANNIPSVNATVALFEAKNLGKAQSLYRLVKATRIVLIVLTLVLLAAGVWVARHRRRALIGAGLGLAASMLVLAIGLLIGRSIYLSSVPSNVLPADAAAAAWDAFVHFVKVTLRVVLAVGLVVALGAFITGPSRMAIQIRSALKSGMDWIRNFGERRGVSTGPVGEWTYSHRRVLRISAVALFALIFVFWGQPDLLVVIVLVVLLLVVLGLIELIGRPPAEPRTATQT